MKHMTDINYMVFHVFKLTDDEQVVGVVLKRNWDKDDEENYFVTMSSNLDKIPVVGSTIMIEQRIGNTGVPATPTHLIPAWVGPVGDSSYQIRFMYLTYLYQRGLGKPYGAPQEVCDQKSYDPAVVFATPECVLLERLHDTLNSKKLREEVAANDYELRKRGIISHFPGNEIHIQTPRVLKYYPEERTVIVTFALGTEDNKNKLLIQQLQARTKIDVTPVKVNIMRVYRDEGWRSLTDLMREDQQLADFVKQYYDNGYGTVIGRTNPPK